VLSEQTDPSTEGPALEPVGPPKPADKVSVWACSEVIVPDVAKEEAKDGAKEGVIKLYH
jgi:hypothetical protein